MQILKFGAADAQGPVMLFLHGFPGLRSKQNRDFAEKAVQALGGRAYVPLYAGLGQAEGVFKFSTCLTKIRAFVAELLQHEIGREIYVAGHSWGGLLSLLIASEHPERVTKVALLSPLLDFAAMGDIRHGFAEERLKHPSLSFGTVDDLAEDFDELAATVDVRGAIAAIPAETEVLFLQADGDPITPTSSAELMLKSFKRAPEFKLVNVDHSFLGPARDEVAELVVGHFQTLKARTARAR